MNLRLQKQTGHPKTSMKKVTQNIVPKNGEGVWVGKKKLKLDLRKASLAENDVFTACRHRTAVFCYFGSRTPFLEFPVET